MNDSERSLSPDKSRFEQWLAKSVYRAECPDSIRLGEYVMGLLSNVDVVVVDEHLNKCPKCRRDLNILRTFLAEENALEGRGSTFNSIIDRIQRPFRRLIALPQNVDALGAGSHMALRGTVGDQLVFEVDVVQVVIDIQSEPENQKLRVIYGLVQGLENESDVEVFLWQSAIQIATTKLDKLANFSFDAVSRGEYQIVLTSDAMEIVINGVVVG